MLSNDRKLKTVSFNDLKKAKTVNIKKDPLIKALLTDLSTNKDHCKVYSEHFSLNPNDIDSILNIIASLSSSISNLTSNEPIPEDVKPYIDALKSLYLKSNMSADINLISGVTAPEDTTFNLF